MGEIEHEQEHEHDYEKKDHRHWCLGYLRCSSFLIFG